MDGITLQEMSYETVQQLHANYVRQPAFAHTQGIAAAYTVTLDPAPTSLPDGFGITIVPHVANVANPTLDINGFGAISLKNQKGIAYTDGKLQLGKPYTFRKVGTDFLADSSGGTGTALAGDIRAGKTATTDVGEIIGTLPIRTSGPLVITPTNAVQTLQSGIYDGSITIKADSTLGVIPLYVSGKNKNLARDITQEGSSILFGNSNLTFEVFSTSGQGLATVSTTDLIDITTIKKLVVDGLGTQTQYGGYFYIGISKSRGVTFIGSQQFTTHAVISATDFGISKEITLDLSAYTGLYYVTLMGRNTLNVNKATININSAILIP